MLSILCLVNLSLFDGTAGKHSEEMQEETQSITAGSSATLFQTFRTLQECTQFFGSNFRQLIGHGLKVKVFGVVMVQWARLWRENNRLIPLSTQIQPAAMHCVRDSAHAPFPLFFQL